MPAQIVIAHDDPALRDGIAEALSAAGHAVATFAGSMDALVALESAQAVELLITRVQFPAGQPNGVSLAQMARLRHSGLRVLFVAHPQTEPHTEGLGAFVPKCAPVVDIAARAEALLASKQRP
jgi:DNA-binding response OmpR family regulator